MAGKKNYEKTFLRGLTTGSTYRFSEEVASDLEVYAVVRKYGSKKDMIEEGLRLFFKKNKLTPKVRQAAMLILEEGAE